MKNGLKAIIKNVAKSIKNYCEREEEFDEAYIYKQSSNNGNCTQYCVNGKLSMLLDNLKKETVGYTNDYIKSEEYHVIGNKRFLIIKETLEEGMYIVNLNNKVIFYKFLISLMTLISLILLIYLIQLVTVGLTKGLSVEQEEFLDEEEVEFVKKLGNLRYRKLVDGLKSHENNIDEVDYFGGDIGEVTKLFEEA